MKSCVIYYSSKISQVSLMTSIGGSFLYSFIDSDELEGVLRTFYTYLEMLTSPFFKSRRRWLLPREVVLFKIDSLGLNI
jgi:hypothetical protein